MNNLTLLYDFAMLVQDFFTGDTAGHAVYLKARANYVLGKCEDDGFPTPEIDPTTTLLFEYLERVRHLKETIETQGKVIMRLEEELEGYRAVQDEQAAYLARMNLCEEPFKLSRLDEELEAVENVFLHGTDEEVKSIVEEEVFPPAGNATDE